MGVPTSEVGYTSATNGRGHHEVHKGHVAGGKKKKFTAYQASNDSIQQDPGVKNVALTETAPQPLSKATNRNLEKRTSQTPRFISNTIAALSGSNLWRQNRHNATKPLYQMVTFKYELPFRPTANIHDVTKLSTWTHKHVALTQDTLSL
jgi:hypothetical protein